MSKCSWYRGGHNIEWSSEPFWTIEYYSQPDRTVPVKGLHVGYCRKCGEHFTQDNRYYEDAYEPYTLDNYPTNKKEQK